MRAANRAYAVTHKSTVNRGAFYGDPAETPPGAGCQQKANKTMGAPRSRSDPVEVNVLLSFRGVGDGQTHQPALVGIDLRCDLPQE